MAKPPTYWGKLTDEELLRVTFTTDDPEGLEGLVLDVPASDGRPFVEYAYDFRGSKRDFIRCAHCKYPNHLAGFVIKTAAGERFLCGHDCGEKIYGADFKTFRKDWSDARDKAAALHRIANMRRALPDFIAYINGVRTSLALTQFQATKNDFRNKMPRLFDAVQGAALHRGGELFVEDKVRDFNAEVRDEERYERELAEWKNETVTERKRLRKMGYGEPEKPRKPLFKSEPRRVGFVPTARLFETGQTPKQILDAIGEQFERLANPPSASMSEAARNNLYAYRGRKDADVTLALTRNALNAAGDENSTKGMEALLRQINELLDRIEEQLDRLGELTTFFQPTTLLPIIEWAAFRRIPGKFTAGLLSLTCAFDRGDQVVRVPPDYKVPSRAGIVAFREAVNRSR